MLSRVKKDDTVYILSGKDKGKTGKVIKMIKSSDKVLVKGIGIVTKHLKARKSGEKSRIIKEERPIPLGKVMPVCTSCKKQCRTQVKLLENGTKARTCQKCKEAF